MPFDVEMEPSEMASLNHISFLTFIFLLLVVLCLHYSCARKLLLDDLTYTPPYRPSPPAPIPCDPSCNPFDRSCNPSSPSCYEYLPTPCMDIHPCPPIIYNKTASYTSHAPGYKEKPDGAPMSTSPLRPNNDDEPPGKEKQDSAPMSTSPLTRNHKKQEGAPMASEPKLRGKSEAHENRESSQPAHGVVSTYGSTKATQKMAHGGLPASYIKDDNTQLHASSPIPLKSGKTTLENQSVVPVYFE